MRIRWQGIRGFWRRKIYHFVFIFSLLALALLVTWWAIFLNRSVNLAHDLTYEKLSMSLEIHAYTMGHTKGVRPPLGIMVKDQRMEIVRTTDITTGDSRPLIPFWGELSIRPTRWHLDEIEDKHRRKRLMIVGESGLLMVLILVSGLMIYRMYWLEKRTTRELNEFWSRVSHEIKTPITGLKAFLETLQNGDLSRDELEPLIQLALKQVERQRQLAENMLIGQRIKRGGIGIKLKPVDLDEFISNYLETHHVGLSRSKVLLDIDPGAETIVKADTESLHVIFDNIIDNAVKYGGNELHLNLRVTSEGRSGIVEIRDNGPGFDPEMRENIFKAFSRLGSELPGGQHGTGMGLHISRQLARTMGGNLTASSEGKGMGATFTLSLEGVRRNVDE